MEKKEFKSSFSDYTDTSNCGLETERRTKPGFEVFIYDENIRVIRRREHSISITDILGIRAMGSGMDCKLSQNIQRVISDTIRRILDKVEIHGYSYSSDHTVILMTIDQEDRIIRREDLERVCEFITHGDMSPEVMRSIISIADKGDFSGQLWSIMLEYALG